MPRSGKEEASDSDDDSQEIIADIAPAQPTTPTSTPFYVVTPAKSTPFIQRSNKIKNMCTLPGVLVPPSPYSEAPRATKRNRGRQKRGYRRP